jgi:hypothetical protein
MRAIGILGYGGICLRIIEHELARAAVLSHGSHEIRMTGAIDEGDDHVLVPLHPEQIVNESMTAQIYGMTAIVTGIYREKGVTGGRSYVRRGSIIDTWINQDGTWRCTTSQSTLISH